MFDCFTNGTLTLQGSYLMLNDGPCPLLTKCRGLIMEIRATKNPKYIVRFYFKTTLQVYKG
jgi:hypothetical protein